MSATADIFDIDHDDVRELMLGQFDTTCVFIWIDVAGNATAVIVDVVATKPLDVHRHVPDIYLCKLLHWNVPPD